MMVAFLNKKSVFLPEKVFLYITGWNDVKLSLNRHGKKREKGTLISQSITHQTLA